MKKFRKTNNGLFICEECERTFNNYQGLRTHIRHSHSDLSQKDYYDKWIKDKNDDKCKICGKKTVFDSLNNGYKECCNKYHTDLYAYKKKANTMKKKYGYENQFQREDVKFKSQEKHLKIYGVENPRQSKIIQQKAKETSKEKYGSETYNNSNKRKITNVEKYGYDTILRDKEKMRAATIKKYGVENVMYVPEIFQKQQLSGFNAHKYKNTSLYYRGSYELNFLDMYYDKYPDIQNAPIVKYEFNGESKIYHPDFYIPSKNLIIEIKSSYYYIKYKEKCIAKENATKLNGYNYLLILDQNYEEF